MFTPELQTTKTKSNKSISGRYRNYGAITWFASQLLNDSLVLTVDLPAKIVIEDC